MRSPSRGAVFELVRPPVEPILQLGQNQQDFAPNTARAEKQERCRFHLASGGCGWRCRCGHIGEHLLDARVEIDRHREHDGGVLLHADFS